MGFMPTTQTPSIYLRNRFTLQGSRNAEFLAGKEQLLRSTLSRWKLVAGCGERAVRVGRNLAEPALQMIHVWELDTWPSLYEVMYELSEAKWYRELGAAVASENQELLVNFTSGYGIASRRPWQRDDAPGYRYLSEELMLSRTTTMHAFMRELNWLAAELSRASIYRTCCARQITGRPGLICLLWQVPEQVDFYAQLDRIADDPKLAARYTRMLQTVGDLRREVLEPIYTERLDERIRAGESARIVQVGTTSHTHPGGAVMPSGLALG
jgi:hypothetical protein